MTMRAKRKEKKRKKEKKSGRIYHIVYFAVSTDNKEKIQEKELRDEYLHLAR